MNVRGHTVRTFRCRECYAAHVGTLMPMCDVRARCSRYDYGVIRGNKITPETRVRACVRPFAGGGSHCGATAVIIIYGLVRQLSHTVVCGM